jgi:hypothetical protein
VTGSDWASSRLLEIPVGYVPVSSSAWTRSPERVRVAAMLLTTTSCAAMLLTTTSWLVSGLPRQFIVIWENSRCSILFHFEVPGGK